MAEIVEIFREHVPTMVFIGKKYTEADRIEGSFAAYWQQWFGDGSFERLEAHITSHDPDHQLSSVYPDAFSYLGLMYYHESKGFEYWIGMFAKEDTPPLADFDCFTFNESELGVAWVYGTEPEIYWQAENCVQGFLEKGFTLAPDTEGGQWFFERYVCPRFTEPDEKGNKILDMCYVIR